MRFRSTLILMLLATVVGVLLWRGEQWWTPTRERETHKARPLDFDAAQVNAAEIDAAESTVSLIVKDHLWQASKPFEDMADPDRVTALIASLHDTEWLETVRREDMPDAAWRMTGLDKPFARVRLLHDGKTLAEAWAGNGSPIEGAIYMAVPGKGGEKDMFVARTNLLTVLKKPVDAWRDDHLVRVPAESVSRILIEDGQGAIELSRDKPKAPWNLAKPFQTRAHNERVNELLAALLSLKITASTTGEVKTAPAESFKFSVTSPIFADPVVITLAKPVDAKALTTSATASHRSHGFSVASDRLQTLWMPLNELRDDHLARIDVENLDAIVVRGAGTGDVNLKKEGGRWMLQRHGEWTPANGDRIASTFKALNENQVREFVADSAANLTPYGLKEPFLTLAWNDTSTSRAAPAAAGTGNGFTVEPVIGLNTALHFGIDKDNHLYAKYEDEPFIYRVGASVLNAVPRDSARWKALNPVRFTQFGLRNITLSMGTNPPVSLDYNPVTAEWKGTRAGQDLTPYIDRVKADRMSGKLATLVVDDWVQDRSAAVKALQTPSITVAITVDVEPGNLKSATRVITLNFAPTVPAPDAAMFYGRLDNEPDIFTINRISLHEAIRSVMKD